MAAAAFSRSALAVGIIARRSSLGQRDEGRSSVGDTFASVELLQTKNKVVKATDEHKQQSARSCSATEHAAYFSHFASKPSFYALFCRFAS